MNMQCLIGYKQRRGMPAGEGPESCAAVWKGQATGLRCLRDQGPVACVTRWGGCLRDQKGKLMPRFTEAFELRGANSLVTLPSVWSMPRKRLNPLGCTLSIQPNEVP